MNDATMHLTPDEIELWAQGLLGAARTMHLADCSLCLAEGEKERRIILELASLTAFTPTEGFADRVMGQVKIPTPSGEFGA